MLTEYLKRFVQDKTIGVLENNRRKIWEVDIPSDMEYLMKTYGNAF